MEGGLMAHPFEECRARLRQHYNRLSAEYDLPLDIAHAIVISGVFCLSVAREAVHRGYSKKKQAAIGAWVDTWLLYAKAHGISAARMEAIINEATTMVTDMLELIDEHTLARVVGKMADPNA
jgi:hypothetical protein